MAGDDPSSAETTEPPRLGSYRLVEPLGSGGMSSVFRAAHMETGVEVALKILPRNLARNKTLLQRFLREAKSAEALEHPNIVAIYDHGVDNGQYYLVLEFVPGGDLHDWVRKVGPMPIRDAVAAIKSVAEGLAFAASQGLIHRDVKPANLLRSPDGTIKIADLGLALQAEAEDERVTREGTTVGTVDYMAPEQARDSRGTSERSDIYSLGCTLYFLLTGQPPFPGGDVTEKLTRHFTAPPPDPTDFRPDVPPKLRMLLRKMMAKRPENRFANYAELIAALDSIPLETHPPLPPTETLVALFDDDEDDAVEAQAATPGPPAAGPNADGEPAALDAVFDDEEDAPASDAFLPLDLSEGEGPRPVPQDRRTADVLMADLASMTGDDRPAVRRVDRDDRDPGRRSGMIPAVAPPDGDDDETAVEGKLPAQVAFRSGRVLSDEERTWLKALVLGGVGLIVAVIAFHQLYRSTLTDSVAVSTEPDVLAPEPVEPPVPTSPQRPTVAPPKTLTPPPKKDATNLASVAKKASITASVSTAPGHPGTDEPIRPPIGSDPEPEFPPEVEARYRPEWTAVEVPVDVAGKFLNVRRLIDPRDPNQRARLGAALGVIGNGTTEISDNGPFFEDDLRLSGENRLVRAGAGFRPVICLDTPRPGVVSQQPSYLDVESRTLTLEGLDLVVDAKDLPRNFGSLFLCRGGSLTLRDCTMTVVNRGGLPLSLVQTVEGAKPSRVRFERTLVRGGFTSAVDIASGAADVVISRTAVVNSQGAAVTSVVSGAGERRVYVWRSLIATRGPAFELAESQPGVKSHPLTVRALASTFAHLAAPGRTSLIASMGEGGAPSEAVNWLGEANAFAGWSDWLSIGGSHKVVVPDLPAAREAWNGTDTRSVASPAVRPLSVAADHIRIDALRGLAPERHQMLSRLPTPTPLIHEKTLEPFPRPFVPGLTGAGGTPPTTPMASPLPGSVVANRPGVRELAFDTEAPQLSGDLGRFLAANLRPTDVLVRVVVAGNGPHAWTPVKVPDGVSVMIDVRPDKLGLSPSWSPAKSAAGEALIAARGGSLLLTGVKFQQTGPSRLKCLIRVDGGHLVIHQGRLIARGPTESGAGGLIEFRAAGTSPLKPTTAAGETWPFGVGTDRPTCRLTESVLITGGVAITAEVGRGIVALSQCAVASGPSAFALRPAPVPRDRLEADLWLDRCTVASEHAFVTLGAPQGGPSTPDRPWLVSTHRSAFFASFDRRAADSVLLRANPETFARGGLFWQSSGDAFEVPYFAAGGDAVPPANHRPDVSRQWAEVWGRAHFRGVTGPRQPGGTMTRWLVNRSLKPGDVQPGDLAIDPTFPKDDPPRDLGVDLARLKINASPRTTRKR